MINTQSRRCSKALEHAQYLWLKYASDTESAIPFDIVKSYLRPSQIIKDDHDILVTEDGFVTMAILIAHASRYDGLIAVPGCDETGRQGYLILSKGKVPYHSLANTAERACNEAKNKQTLADKLIQHFGSKPALYSAVNEAPVFQRCTREDLEHSGLCLWGAESFLQRIGLLSVARNFGLPKFMLLLAGNYGRRIIAASVMRDQRFDLTEVA